MTPNGMIRGQPANARGCPLQEGLGGRYLPSGSRREAQHMLRSVWSHAPLGCSEDSTSSVEPDTL